MRLHNKPDKFLFAIILTLALAGFFVFASASLGLLNRNGASFTLVAGKQLGILAVGIIAMMLVSRINYKNWAKFTWPIFILSIILTALVFVPGIGIAHGGARRWLYLGIGSFQPAELLKFGIVLFLAAWYSHKKDLARTMTFGLLPFILVVGVAYGLLKYQPDTGTFLVVFATALALYIAAGAKWRYLLLILIIGAGAVSFHAYQAPYARERILTFLNPSRDINGAGYQINQSLIAIGSGGITGRGFGQSIQKFKFLPEPIGDSIFAVASEEFGFVGSVTLIMLYLIFAAWGLKICSGVRDSFGRLFGVGLVILISSQSFINIAAMLGVIPLTGVPLIFVSHGGSALLLALIESGILLNISRYR